jgi:uncharacterized membrane protein YfhO
VDGSESPIHRVDHAFRGVIVATGRHQIEFRYEPASFAWGIRLMLLATAAAAFWALRLRRQAV